MKPKSQILDYSDDVTNKTLQGTLQWRYDRRV